MAETQPLTDTITFLGTGGARFMIITQLLASGGFWLNLGGTEILVDPGPGCIVQATKRKLNAEHLSAIILSHRHLDHSADTNIMVEAMTNGGMNQHGQLFAPLDALDFEPVIYSYLRGYLDSVELLQEGKCYSVGDVSFATPVRHIHRVETYGIVFKTPRHTFSYITDTRYFDGLLKHYAAELLIMNLVFLEPRYPSDNPLTPADHLSVPDAERLIKELKPKAAILTHFGMNVWRAQPWKIAEWLTERTGVKVIAARDGMKFDLGTMDGGKE
ncbi:MAG: MBL fold metallo-hydrolase [Chloroflexi bacterium]|nr:MBL fold metallo-hydrolase [Chloroflexota bacterium]